MSRKIHNMEAGYKAERMNPYVPGQKVVIYIAEIQGIDVYGRYAVVCDAHANIIGESGLRGARLSMKDPSNFCDECRELRHKMPTKGGA